MISIIKINNINYKGNCSPIHGPITPVVIGLNAGPYCNYNNSDNNNNNNDNNDTTTSNLRHHHCDPVPLSYLRYYCR